jgi:hypothetical protein
MDDLLQPAIASAHYPETEKRMGTTTAAYTKEVERDQATILDSM